MNEDQEKFELSIFALGLQNKHGKSLDEVSSKVVEKMITLHAFGVSRSDALLSGFKMIEEIVKSLIGDDPFYVSHYALTIFRHAAHNFNEEFGYTDEVAPRS
ncbi:hypothetical protein [Ktedonobacter racemifer]|uniref:Uncharacterized protein n=1 Tax=Ktedonobacter racemifer DSM 44963 TaxID=485913 RepID=D6U3C1_KTERA|nr:hypothetical protein [Ktedonobacter racemifer]EFH81125.1 hypothetical protein Krac_1816 [Ktedonobacter racemifer DSM 44963]